MHQLKLRLTNPSIRRVLYDGGILVVVVVEGKGKERKIKNNNKNKNKNKIHTAPYGR